MKKKVKTDLIQSYFDSRQSNYERIDLLFKDSIKTIQNSTDGSLKYIFLNIWKKILFILWNLKL